MNNKNNLNKNLENNSLVKLDWNSVQSEMKNKLGNDIYESWLKKISFVEEFNNYILLSVSTRFIRDWITSRYLDQILHIIKMQKKGINRIEVIINSNNDDLTKKNISFENDTISERKNVSFIKDSFLQYNRIDPNKKFENFIIGSSNKLALEASKKLLKIFLIIILYIFMVGLAWEKHIY